MFDNREIASLIWITVFAAWAITQPRVRLGAIGVIKAALDWKIVLVAFLMAGYITIVVLILFQTGAWELVNIKPTIIWAFTAGLFMVFEVQEITNDDRYFWKAVIDGLKISAILEFLINVQVLSLPLELLLIPTATAISCAAVIAESRDEFRDVRALLKGAMTLLGLALCAYAAWRIYIDFDSFATVSTLLEFLLPIVLTFSFIPFLYCLAAVVSYENIFVRLRTYPKT